MTSEYSTRAGQAQHHHQYPHAKIVLDYSFCNASDLWNYLGIIVIVLFLSVLFSYLRHRQEQKANNYHQDRYAWVYLSILIVLALVFVVPFMCWSLAIVEVFVTFIRYGQISASPLPILSLPIRLIAFVYTKLISSINWYLTAPGTFIFLFFFLALKCLKIIFLLILRFRFPAFLLCSWLGFAVPLYALIEVGTIDSWIDFAFNCQLPLLIVLKFSPLLLGVRRPILWLVVFLLFLFLFFLKFGLTFLFVCKCVLIIILVRFTYVIGKAFVVFMFFTPKTTNSTGNDVQ